MPFALIAYFYALWSTDTPFEWLLLVKVLLAMVFARNTAMGFNRYADRSIDAMNPRTAQWHIPAGRISARNALWFIIVNALLFAATAAWINFLAFSSLPPCTDRAVGIQPDQTLHRLVPHRTRHCAGDRPRGHTLRLRDNSPCCRSC